MAYEEAYKIIDEIKFGILSPQEIRRLSVVEIQTADTSRMEPLYLQG